ncbi:hypothetical protein K7X08_008619 [Anisodus acutangulus]|uniref:Pentatricopeptide repeat-containing protein n=1 Tax=Anisodus acutangulus TaxID=402998 RepID=A0A9Q1RTY3_9SOLA|nr:hypothetical protein K7X08_008619 [Anisodus acutangulus]
MRVPLPWNSNWCSRFKELLCHGKSQDVLHQYRELNKSGVELTDHSVYPILLKACLNLSTTHGNSIHASLIKQGFLAFTSVANSLMDFYAKSGDLGSAVVVFNCMDNKDSVSWNVIIHGHLERAAASSRRGLCFFTQAWAAGFEPNISTLVLVIQTCRILRAFEVGQTIHGSTIRAGYSSITSLQNSLLNFYAEFGMQLAHNFFDEVPDRDVISWSVMVAGYAQSEEETMVALEFFQRMIDFGIIPDGQSVVSVLKACSKLRAIRMGESIHGFVISRGLGYDLFIQNSLIDLYSKCNDVDSLLRVFREIPEKNVVSWNSLLSGLVQNEKHSEALALFDSMQKARVESDEVTLVNLIQLCKSFLDPYQCKLMHSRMLRRGFELNELVTNSLIDAYASCNLITYAWSQFSNMKARDAVTWSTMIAGFTHCGMPDEAIAVFQEMSHTTERPNAITMLNLLEACSLTADLKRSRNYENYEFGASVLPQVLELEPSSSAGYLLASNMYASGHSWVDATKMRMLAKEGGVKVTAGYSLVYVNGKACRFLAGDKHHSLSHELQFAVQQLHSCMKMDLTCG